MFIDWIWAPGNGKPVFDKMLKMNPHISTVVLNVSVPRIQDNVAVIERISHRSRDALLD